MNHFSKTLFIAVCFSVCHFGQAQSPFRSIGLTHTNITALASEGGDRLSAYALSSTLLFAGTDTSGVYVFSLLDSTRGWRPFGFQTTKQRFITSLSVQRFKNASDSLNVYAGLGNDIFESSLPALYRTTIPPEADNAGEWKPYSKGFENPARRDTGAIVYSIAAFHSADGFPQQPLFVGTGDRVYRRAQNDTAWTPLSYHPNWVNGFCLPSRWQGSTLAAGG